MVGGNVRKFGGVVEMPGKHSYYRNNVFSATIVEQASYTDC